MRAMRALRARIEDHESAPASRGRKYAFVTDEMLPWRHDEPGEATQKLERGEKPMGVAVLARFAQRERDAAVLRELELLVGEWRPQTVANEALATVVVGRLDAHVGVDVDAVYFDETRAEPHRRARTTVSRHRGAVVSQRARRDEVARRRFVEPLQRRRRLVLLRGELAFVRDQPAPLQDAANRRVQVDRHRLHGLRRRRACIVELRSPVVAHGEHAVGADEMDVRV